MTEAEGSVTPADLSTELFACRLRCALRRSGGASRHRRGARSTNAGRLRGWPHSQFQDRALADDRRDDLGHRLGAHGREYVDQRYGSFIAQDLASYHVAVNADVGVMEVVFLHEDDPNGSPLGSKGIGELGICGAGAAVINAIHNATGARIRDLPATPDKLLPALEMLDD